MRIQKRIVLSIVIALTITTAASAQRRTTPAMPSEAGVAIALQVAGQSYHFEGQALCQHAPVASIYNVAAAMWSIHQSDGHRSIVLTLWHPRTASGDLVMLNVDTGGRSYVVNTVKPTPGSAVQGAGKVTVTPSGAGATFTIDATSASGAAITGTIRCSSFTHPVAEGGD